jgi:hypothetical protein
MLTARGSVDILRYLRFLLCNSFLRLCVLRDLLFYTAEFYAFYLDLLTRPVSVKFVHPPPAHNLDD